MENEDPWAWMQPYDVRRFGEVIMDPKEQERWCRAVLLGGLPFMWRKAEVARNLIYDRLELREGDKVLVIGECIEPCGFVGDIRNRIGPRGEIKVFDITDEARDNYIAKKVGRGGQLATWAWSYTRDLPDGSFDCAVCLQGVQHTDDWRETGSDMLRVMKRGRNIVLAEIAYSPETQMKIGTRHAHRVRLRQAALQSWLETGGVSLLQSAGPRRGLQGPGQRSGPLRLEGN